MFRKLLLVTIAIWVFSNSLFASSDKGSSSVDPSSVVTNNLRVNEYLTLLPKEEALLLFRERTSTGGEIEVPESFRVSLRGNKTEGPSDPRAQIYGSGVVGYMNAGFQSNMFKTKELFRKFYQESFMERMTNQSQAALDEIENGHQARMAKIKDERTRHPEEEIRVGDAQAREAQVGGPSATRPAKALLCAGTPGALHSIASPSVACSLDSSSTEVNESTLNYVINLTAEHLLKQTEAVTVGESTQEFSFSFFEIGIDEDHVFLLIEKCPDNLAIYDKDELIYRVKNKSIIFAKKVMFVPASGRALFLARFRSDLQYELVQGIRIPF